MLGKLKKRINKVVFGEKKSQPLLVAGPDLIIAAAFWDLLEQKWREKDYAEALVIALVFPLLFRWFRPFIKGWFEVAG